MKRDSLRFMRNVQYSQAPLAAEDVAVTLLNRLLELDFDMLAPQHKHTLVEPAQG
jgi:hypothetical protein